jgi:sulfoxide reductase heme-binding subunit YedZ
VLIAAGTPEFVWYLMRGSGLVALMLFTLTVSLGVVSVTRLQSPRWPRLVTGELHRNVALLASCFLALHVGTALVDSWVGLNWIGVLFPFQSAYRPLWVGFGVLAFDVFLAILATSLLRRRIGARVWRLVHWGTWVMWPLALSHALGSGTDTTSGWGLGICVACIATVGAAATWRVCWVLRSHRHPQRGRVHPTPRGPGDTPAVVGAFGHPASDVGAPRSVLPASLR